MVIKSFGTVVGRCAVITKLYRRCALVTKGYRKVRLGYYGVQEGAPWLTNGSGTAV